MRQTLSRRMQRFSGATGALRFLGILALEHALPQNQRGLGTKLRLDQCSMTSRILKQRYGCSASEKKEASPVIPSARCICFAASVMTFLGCANSKQDEVRIGAAEKADLLFVLKEGTSAAAESTWLDSCVRVQGNPKPGQFVLRPGVRALARVRVGGLAGYAVLFRGNASVERRAQVKAECERADIVERALENVVPGEI